MSQMAMNAKEDRSKKKAMTISLIIGFLLLAIKIYAYYKTKSTAILSDTMESVVHLFAVGFATYSMWLSLKPADRDHPYGHDRISFFSAGFEGGIIGVAALFIVYEAIQKWISGVEISHLETGFVYILAALIINGVLGLYLINKGKKTTSLVLQANGKHILTDCWTSCGVMLALVLTKFTKQAFFDPLIALLIGLNILWTGYKLIKESVFGLMDTIDPNVDKLLHEILDDETKKYNLTYHRLRHRNAGTRIFCEVHLQFIGQMHISEAHAIATRIECCVVKRLGRNAELMTHLEPIENHDEAHLSIWNEELKT